MYVCIVCTYVLRMYVRTYVCVRTCLYLCIMNERTNVYVCMCVCVYMYVRTYAYVSMSHNNALRVNFCIVLSA
jgi:hypothetical protein